MALGALPIGAHERNLFVVPLLAFEHMTHRLGLSSELSLDERGALREAALANWVGPIRYLLTLVPYDDDHVALADWVIPTPSPVTDTTLASAAPSSHSCNPLQWTTTGSCISHSPCSSNPLVSQFRQEAMRSEEVVKVDFVMFRRFQDRYHIAKNPDLESNKAIADYMASNGFMEALEAFKKETDMVREAYV
ncbi:hypothetical protein HPB51_025824 [Rhipicephalus microplus]|uniref:PAC1-like LisH-like dimerisation domain-containing protein n=1 Tax=Rhipicephalus microplus TaxID=6941 RepID=A0A9J6F9W1_RHIMP|nr:hypothetical protein HPB51_025824 [Rhipicephalus microplus]